MSRDDTAKAERDVVSMLKVDAFKDHVLTERRPWVWKCARPNRWEYGFYVLIAPGAVTIYGDISEAVFRMSEGSEANVLAWLKGSVQDPHYLLSKINPRDAFRKFYAGDAIKWANEQDDVLYKSDVEQADSYGMWAEKFYEISHDYGLYDCPECVDWNATAWWLHGALERFVALNPEAPKGTV